MKELNFDEMESINGGGWFSNWGDNTLECMEEVYTGHGWASVAATMVSTAIPQTVGIFGGYCAGKALVYTLS